MIWATVQTVVGPLAGLVGLVYGAGPLIVSRAFWLDPSAERPLADLTDPAVPRDAVEYVADMTEELERLGFEFVAFFTDTASVPGSSAAAAVFVNQRERHTAMAATMYAHAQGNTTRSDQFVEFSSQLADGTDVNTNNCKAAPAVPPGGPRLIVARRVRDTAALYRVHQVHLRLAGNQERRPVDADAALSEVRASYDKFAARMIRTGWGRRCRDGRIRLTLRGSYAMCWRILPPTAQIRARRGARLAERAIAEAGV